LVTPFRKDLSLGEDALRRLIRRKSRGGSIPGPCGTTGESPTLTHEEHLRVVAITIEEAKGKVPVLGGAGGYDTAKVIEMAREIERMGADGILSVTPYYKQADAGGPSTSITRPSRPRSLSPSFCTTCPREPT